MMFLRRDAFEAFSGHDKLCEIFGGVLPALHTGDEIALFSELGCECTSLPKAQNNHPPVK